MFNSLAPEKFQWKLVRRSITSFQGNFIDWWVMFLLGNCSHMNVTGLNWWSINIASGNGLVPSGNKTLPEPMLTQISCRHMASLGPNEFNQVSATPLKIQGAHRFHVLVGKWQSRGFIRGSTGMFGNLMAIYHIMLQFIQNHSRFVMLMIWK